MHRPEAQALQSSNLCSGGIVQSEKSFLLELQASKISLPRWLGFDILSYEIYHVVLCLLGNVIIKCINLNYQKKFWKPIFGLDCSIIQQILICVSTRVHTSVQMKVISTSEFIRYIIPISNVYQSAQKIIHQCK